MSDIDEGMITLGQLVTMIQLQLKTFFSPIDKLMRFIKFRNSEHFSKARASSHTAVTGNALSAEARNIANPIICTHKNKYKRYYGPGRWRHLVKNLRR